MDIQFGTYAPHVAARLGKGVLGGSGIGWVISRASPGERWKLWRDGKHLETFTPDAPGPAEAPEPPPTPTIFFVLNGLMNGEEGEMAMTCGVGETMPDGWYYIFDGMDDGQGPSASRRGAETAAYKYIELCQDEGEDDDSSPDYFAVYEANGKLVHYGTEKEAEQLCTDGEKVYLAKTRTEYPRPHEIGNSTHLVAEVIEHSKGTFEIEATQWYSSEGVCRLTVSYCDLDVALKMFGAALRTNAVSDGP